jgi:hypothetical protein
MAGPALELPPWRHVAAPDPFPGERGVWALEASWRDRSVEAWPPHVVALDLPEESGPVETIPEHSIHTGMWRRRVYESTGRSGDHNPSCQTRAVRHVTQMVREGLG